MVEQKSSHSIKKNKWQEHEPEIHVKPSGEFDPSALLLPFTDSCERTHTERRSLIENGSQLQDIQVYECWTDVPQENDASNWVITSHQMRCMG